MSRSARRRLFDEQDNAMEVDSSLEQNPLISNSFAQDRMQRDQRFAQHIMNTPSLQINLMYDDRDELPSDIRELVEALNIRHDNAD